jgi:hypothetical protein
MKPTEFAKAWATYKAQIHDIDLRLTKIENRHRTAELIKRLPPCSLNHCEVF